MRLEIGRQWSLGITQEILGCKITRLEFRESLVEEMKTHREPQQDESNKCSYQLESGELKQLPMILKNERMFRKPMNCLTFFAKL